MKMLRQGFSGLRAVVQGGYGGSRGVMGRGLGGGREGIDMRAEARRKIDNSIVYTALSKTLLPLLEAELFVARTGRRRPLKDRRAGLPLPTPRRST